MAAGGAAATDDPPLHRLVSRRCPPLSVFMRPTRRPFLAPFLCGHIQTVSFFPVSLIHTLAGEEQPGVLLVVVVVVPASYL